MNCQTFSQNPRMPGKSHHQKATTTGSVQSPDRLGCLGRGGAGWGRGMKDESVQIHIHLLNISLRAAEKKVELAGMRYNSPKNMGLITNSLFSTTFPWENFPTKRQPSSNKCSQLTMQLWWTFENINDLTQASSAQTAMTCCHFMDWGCTYHITVAWPRQFGSVPGNLVSLETWQHSINGGK